MVAAASQSQAVSAKLIDHFESSKSIPVSTEYQSFHEGCGTRHQNPRDWWSGIDHGASDHAAPPQFSLDAAKEYMHKSCFQRQT